MRKWPIGVVLQIPEGQSITPSAFLDESDQFRWFVVVTGRLQVRFVFAAGHATVLEMDRRYSKQRILETKPHVPDNHGLLGPVKRNVWLSGPVFAERL